MHIGIRLMNVLQINTLYKTKYYPFVLGGAEHTAEIVSNELVSEGNNVLVLHCVPRGRGGESELSSRYHTMSLESRNIYWPYEGIYRPSYLRFIWHLIDDFGLIDNKVHKIIEEFNPDIVLIHNMATLSSRYIDVMRKKNLPIVLVLHDYYYVCANSMVFKYEECKKQCLACRILTMHRRRRLKKVSSIVAVSSYLAEKVANFANLPVSSFKVIYNQIGMQTGTPKEPGDTLTFGFLGRISRKKGALDLAYAFNSIEGPMKLLFAGEGDNEVINNIKDLNDDRIAFSGYVDKKWFFANVDVLVVPTLWPEAFGRGVIEGQALGVPAICARSGGLPEAMGGEQYGWLYDPTAKDGLLVAISEVLEKRSLIGDYSKRCIARAHALNSLIDAKLYHRHLLDVLKHHGK